MSVLPKSGNLGGAWEMSRDGSVWQSSSKPIFDSSTVLEMETEIEKSTVTRSHRDNYCEARQNDIHTSVAVHYTDVGFV
jgi:hypothetical protein